MGLLVFVLAFALIAAACTSDSSTTTVTQPESTVTTVAPETSTTTSTVPPTSVPIAASNSISDVVVDQMAAEFGALIAETEEIRGLPFLETPKVAILDDAEFDQRVAAIFEEELVPAEMEVDEAVLALLGMWDPATSLYDFFIDLYTEQVAGFYDPDTKEMVVPASLDGFTTLQRLTVVHELVHALTDQHFDFNDEMEERSDAGTGDDASALQSLVEGDATYFQFIYMQGLSPFEAIQGLTESLAIDTSVLDQAPSWLSADLQFPYDQGLTFVGNLVDVGGIAGVDRAYVAPPATTEQILDASKYARNELPLSLAPLAVTLPGWDEHGEGSYGEWGLRLLFLDTLEPGMNTQTAAGWGNDNYIELTNGEDVATVIHYVGDTELDAEEVASAFVRLGAGPMRAGSRVESGGGLLFDTGSVYVFVDRVEDEVYFVASTDKAAGADLRAQLGL